MFVYSIRDLVADTYGQLITYPNQASALRDFTAAVRNPDTQLSKFPADFDLVQLGEYDQTSGYLTPCAPVVVCHATAVVLPEVTDDV